MRILLLFKLLLMITLCHSYINDNEFIFREPKKVLKCHCDICPIESNHTCETDGLCFAATAIDDEQKITHSYRCFHKADLFPLENPIICRKSEALHSRFVIECCNDSDYCNLNLRPTLAPQLSPDELPDKQVNASDSQIETLQSNLTTKIYNNANKFIHKEFNELLKELPDKPENVLISQIESRSAVISWTLSANTDNSSIISYEVEYKVVGSDWNGSEIIEQTFNGSVNAQTIRVIKPFTDYQIRMRAQNKLGFSDWTQSIQFKTTEEAPSGAPINVQVFALSARSLRIKWSALNSEQRNGQILGYYVGYKAMTSDYGFLYKEMIIDDTDNDMNQLNEVKLTELERCTNYSIIVQAFNSVGSGPRSPQVIAQTLEYDLPYTPILSVEEVLSVNDSLKKWSQTYIQEMVLSLLEKVSILEKSEVNLLESLENLNKSESNLLETVANLNQNLIPIGFIYVQFPGEKTPKEMWSWMTWQEITSSYAGFDTPIGEVRPRNTEIRIWKRYA